MYTCICIHICMRSEAALRQRAQGVLPAIEQIREHPFFQQFEASAPNAAIYMGGTRGDGGVGAVRSDRSKRSHHKQYATYTYIHTHSVICPDGAFVEVSNRLFDASFLASHSFYDEVFRRKTISPFLFPRCA